ncbi:DUF5343 domain-containing protein [bacterium]|nr:MAG: DUF5343 domain-containing protein [bacterium]
MNRVRQLQLKRIDTPTLVKWGSTKYDASSILSAFKFLNLIDDQGKVTENYTALRPDATYKDQLSRIVRSAYARLFELHGDSFEGKNRKDIADTIILDDAYPETAKKSADKAASLFIWLCSQSGIATGSKDATAKVVGATRASSEVKRPAIKPAATKTPPAPTQISQVSGFPLSVSLVITPANTEAEIYEMFRKLNNTLKRLEDENSSN